MKKLPMSLRWHSNSALRYVVVGSWNTLFSIVFLYLLFYFFNNQLYEYELAVTFAFSTAQSYATQRRWVWKSSNSHKIEFPRFIVATGLQYSLNALLLYLAVHTFRLKPSVSALPIILILTGISYFVNRNLVFRGNREVRSSN